MDKKELQKISLKFRKEASRLLNSNYNDSIDNLKRFIIFIDSEKTISDFISEHNITKFNIEEIINKRESENRYPAQFTLNDEISFTYQLLKYAANTFDEHYKFSFGYSYGNKLKDHTEEFNKAIVLPFIQHILTYLDEILIDLNEVVPHSTSNVVFNENKGLVSVNNKGITNISNTTINNADLNNLTNLIDTLLSKIQTDKTLLNNNDEMIEILNETKNELASEKPKKKFIEYLLEKMNQLKDIIYLSTSIYEPVLNLVFEIEKYLKIK